MSAKPKHRQAIVAAAVRLFRRQGYAATGLAQIVEASGAPKGSLYHYFPGGKAQLIEEATSAACEEYGAAFSLIEAMDAADAIPAIVDYWRAQVEATDFSGGCPVAAAALSGEETEGARLKAGAGFAEWTGSIEKMLLTSRVPQARAASAALAAT